MARVTKPSPLEHKNNLKKCRKWRLYIDLGTDEDGKRHKTSHRFEGTYTQAVAELRRLEAELKVPNANSMTLAKYCDKWLEDRKAYIARSTYYRNYKDVRNLKFLFGEKVLLRNVKVKEINDAFNTMLTKGALGGKPCNPRYVAALKITLSSIMKDAIREGYIRENYVAYSRRIPVKTAQRAVPTPTETQELLGKLDTRDGRQMVIFLAASMGLRRGEALGLNWEDVDYKHKEVRIHRVFRDTNELVEHTKTDAGMRTLPLLDWVADAFKEREARAWDDFKHAKARGKFDENAKFDEIAVCCRPSTERISTEMATRWWSHNREKLGHTCTLHDLRHSYLSTLAVSDVPVRVMMELAGHKTPTTTLEIYAHSNPSANRKAAETISDVLNPAKIEKEEEPEEEE